MILAQGQTAHQPRLLLIVQPAKRTVVFLRDTRRAENEVVELLLCHSGIHDEYRH